MEARRTKILGLSLLLFGLVLCGVGLWLMLSPNQYQATTRIRREPPYRDTDFYLLGNGRVFHCFDPYFIQVQFEIIQSPLVLSNVVESLNLNIKWAKTPAEVISLIQRRINLYAITDTTDINISYSSTDSNEVATIANAIGSSYRDYLIDSRKQLFREGIRKLKEQYQKEEHEIQTQHKNLEQLEERLNLPPSEPTGESLKVSVYFLAKQELLELEKSHKILSTNIYCEELNFQFVDSNDWEVKIVEAAKPPEFPVSSNRWLGMTVFIIGLFPSIGGWLLLKSSLHPSHAFRRC